MVASPRDTNSGIARNPRRLSACRGDTHFCVTFWLWAAGCEQQSDRSETTSPQATGCPIDRISQAGSLPEMSIATRLFDLM